MTHDKFIFKVENGIANLQKSKESETLTNFVMEKQEKV